MRRTLLRPEAKANLSEASRWYEERKPGLGAQFLAAIDAVLDKVGKNPLRYPRVYKDVRRAPVRRFPYGIFYLYDNRGISVLRVLHQARDPALWMRRD